MNTIKDIIITYRWWLLLVCFASQFFDLVNLFNIANTYPEFNRNDLTAESDLFVLCMITGFVVSFVIMELRSVTIYLLPASTLRKFATAFAIIVITIASCLLFSLVVDFIGLKLTAGSPQAANFAIGGYIKYVFKETLGFSIFAAFMGLEMSYATLIKNKNIILAINMVLSIVAWTSSLFFQSIGASPILYYVFWGFAILFIIASYQIYKRWEPANNVPHLI